MTDTDGQQPISPLREAVLYGEHASPYIQRLREEGKLDA